MNLLAAPKEERRRRKRKRKKRKRKRRKGKRGKGKRTCCNQQFNLNLYTAYLNFVEVAGLNFEKVWYKVLGQVIYHLESKTMVYKTLLLE